ncbi:unnamed protein product, partial [Tetraodon nigroviridis]
MKGSDKASDKARSSTMKSPPKTFDTTIITKTYYNVVLQNILDAETEFSRELQSVLGSYLRSLHPTDRISSADISHILGNLEEISTFQQMLVQSLEEHTKLPENQQRIGGFFLSLMPQMKSMYVAYCSNHPSAVSVLTQHSQELGEYMESKGASSPGILILTTSLSKPFTRLERYPALLKELDRHMQDQHPDRADLHTCMTAFKNLETMCQEMRKKKDLELQILTEPIRNWEGDDIKTLGPILHQTTVHTPICQKLSECYLVLFPHTLLMLSASPRMSGFIYQVATTRGCRLPVTHRRIYRTGWTFSPNTHTPLLHTRLPALSPWHSLQIVRVTQRERRTIVPHASPPILFWDSPQQQSNMGAPGATKHPKTLELELPPACTTTPALCCTEGGTAALEEDAQILKVIEAYCTSAKTRQTLNSSSSRKDVQMLFPEEEKIIIEETKSNGQTVVEERSLVDTIYSLKDEVQELKQDNKRMRRTLEEEQRARKELERIIRRVLKNMND